MIVLHVIALATELAGLALAAYGFRRTWRAFRRPDDAFWAPVVAPTKGAARVAYVRLRKLLRKPVAQSGVTPHGGSVSIVLGTPTVSATGWAVPPADDTKAFAEYLARRIDHLSEQMQQVRSQVRANADVDAERHTEATQTIKRVREEMHGQVRTITVDGLREQALGWGLIVLGTFLGGLGDIFGGP